MANTTRWLQSLTSKTQFLETTPVYGNCVTFLIRMGITHETAARRTYGNPLHHPSLLPELFCERSGHTTGPSDVGISVVWYGFLLRIVLGSPKILHWGVAVVAAPNPLPQFSKYLTPSHANSPNPKPLKL